MRKTLIISSLLLLVFPIITRAQTTIPTILTTITNIINSIFYILMGLATVVFLWGMVKYIIAGGDEKAKEASKGYIKAGIIGLFMMLAIWGIIRVLVNTFNLDTSPINVQYFQN